MAYAYNNDVVSVASMGNDWDAVFENWPAAHPGVIAVGSIREGGSRSPSSTMGSYIDLCAPGAWGEDPQSSLIRVLGSGATNEYTWNAGTSFAAPHVAGVAALIRGFMPSLSNDDVEQILERSALDRGAGGWDQQYGFGIVKADSALKLLQLPLTLNHYELNSLTLHSIGPLENFALMADPGLGENLFQAKRYELRAAVTFPRRYHNFIAAWGRGSKSRGLSHANPNYATYWTGFVDSSATGAILKTYVYELWTNEPQYVGFWPCIPELARVAWTVFGEELLVSPYLSATTPDTSTRLTWNDTLVNESQWHIDRRVNGVWYNDYKVLPSGTGYTSFVDSNVVGSEQYRYRIHPSNVHQSPAPSEEQWITALPQSPSCVAAYFVYCNIFSPSWSPALCTQNTAPCEGCGEGELEMQFGEGGFSEGSMQFGGEEMMQQSAGPGGPNCQKSNMLVIEWDPPVNQLAGTVV